MVGRAMKVRRDSRHMTGENDSPKSTPAHWKLPQATRRALFFSKIVDEHNRPNEGRERGKQP
jgi:hypothetical protein